jgi:hypothetical protein
MRNARAIVAAVVPLLLAVAPLAARAQAAPAEATDPVPVKPGEPSWSMGAGVGFGFVIASFSSAAPDVSFLRASGVAASIERRLSENTWLAVGVFGSVESTRVRPASALFSSPSESDSRAGAVTLGLRQIVTPAGSPLSVSVLVLGSAAATRTTYDYPSPGDRQEERATAFGASVGLAVDRELTQGLSLRVATSLAQATWSSARLERTGAQTERADGFAAGVALAPSLELRLAF